jgi:general secretion pathway protein D
MRLKLLIPVLFLLGGFSQAEPNIVQNSTKTISRLERIKNFFTSKTNNEQKIAEQTPQQIEAPATPISEPEDTTEFSSSEPMINATDNTTPIAVSEQGHFWNLQQTDIRAVIQEVSKITGRNFLIDPRVQGKLSLISNSKIADKDVYPVFLSMLQVAGFSAIPQGDVIKIVPIMDGRTEAAFSNPLLQNQSSNDALMVQVLPVHYVPAEQLVPVLRPLMPQWSTVTAYGPSNMLILSGRANNISQLAEIIKQVDSSSANGIDIVPLNHALAMDVANTLKEILKSQASSGMRNPPVIAADDRGNAILLSGNKTDRLRLRLLIIELDKQNPNATQSNTQVVYLNYMRAEDLVPILAGIAQAGFSGIVGTTIGTVTQPQLDSSNPAASMIPNPSSGSIPNNPMVSAGGSTTNNSPAGQGSNTQNEGTTKPSVQIIGEPNTNSIIMNGPPSLLKNLKSVIEQLDIKPAQLLVEALVAEIDAEEVNSLGIEWGSINQKSRDASTFNPGFAIINSQTSINQFQSQIYALTRERKANILSTPSVVVLDNRQAKILIGKQVSVASSSYPNNASGTTTASPFTTFDRVNVALHLYVRPQITRDRGIQLQIDQGNDTLQNDELINPGDIPVFNISAIVTSVHVQSGDIIVLGGLAQDKISNDNTDVPILKDIPGIGRLFQHNISNRRKKVLMVFIRPFIMQTNNDVALFSSGKYQHLRQDQLNFSREQESFDQRNRETVAPPWHSEVLPKPFAAQSIHAQK